MNKLHHGFIPLIPILVIGGSFLVTFGVIAVKTEGFRTLSIKAKAGNPCISFTSESECSIQKDEANRTRCRWVSLGDRPQTQTQALGVSDIAMVVAPIETIVPIKTPMPTAVKTPTSTYAPVVETRPETAPIDRMRSIKIRRPATKDPRQPDNLPMNDANLAKGRCVPIALPSIISPTPFPIKKVKVINTLIPMKKITATPTIAPTPTKIPTKKLMPIRTQ